LRGGGVSKHGGDLGGNGQLGAFVVDDAEPAEELVTHLGHTDKQ